MVKAIGKERFQIGSVLFYAMCQPHAQHGPTCPSRSAHLGLGALTFFAGARGLRKKQGRWTPHKLNRDYRGG